MLLPEPLSTDPDPLRCARIELRAPSETEGPLSKDDWIRAAFELLVEEGADKIRIAPIARRLGVTRGSFYWHFRDREHFRDQLLRRWQEMLREAAAAAKLSGGRASKLAGLPRVLATRGLPELDAAIRTWGRRDPVVAGAVARADRLRIRSVEDLLRASGLDARTAAARAPLLLWAHVGSIGAGRKERGAALGELVDLLVKTNPS